MEGARIKPHTCSGFVRRGPIFMTLVAVVAVVGASTGPSSAAVTWNLELSTCIQTFT